MALFSRPRTRRGRRVVHTGIATTLVLYPILSLLYLKDESRILAQTLGSFQPLPIAELTSLLLGFMLATNIIFTILLSKFLLRESDLIYSENRWKRNIQGLSQFQLAYPVMAAALVCGIFLTSVFDVFVSSNMYPSALGWVARILADSYVLVFTMSAFAAIAGRTRNEPPPGTQREIK